MTAARTEGATLRLFSPPRQQRQSAPIPSGGAPEFWPPGIAGGAIMPVADAATAIGYGDRLAPQQLRLVAWKPLRKGKLAGFATVLMAPIGLRLVDCPVFVGGKNGPWCALPSKPELDRDGRRKTDINGQPIYSPVCEWNSREVSDRFSQAVVALVRRAYPEDLED